MQCAAALATLSLLINTTTAADESVGWRAADGHTHKRNFQLPCALGLVGTARAQIMVRDICTRSRALVTARKACGHCPTTGLERARVARLASRSGDCMCVPLVVSGTLFYSTVYPRAQICFFKVVDENGNARQTTGGTRELQGLWVRGRVTTTDIARAARVGARRLCHCRSAGNCMHKHTLLAHTDVHKEHAAISLRDFPHDSYQTPSLTIKRKQITGAVSGGPNF